MAKKYYITGPTKTAKQAKQFRRMGEKLKSHGIPYQTAFDLDYEFNDFSTQGQETARAKRTEAMIQMRQVILLDDMSQCPICIVEVQLAKQLGIPIYHHSVVDALISKTN